MMYAAYDAAGTRLTSVFADSPKEALERLTEELQRPGRGIYYVAWKNGNFQVIVDDATELQFLPELVVESPVVLQDAVYREITIQNQNQEERLGATDAWVIASRMVDPKEWEFHNTRRQHLAKDCITVIFRKLQGIP
jgi:hypothetical protein